MDEELRWVKDETPYLLFRCTKCMQYLYVKIKQKTKKCLRCDATNKIMNIVNTGEIFHGLSNVIEMMKKRQNEIAIKEFGNSPKFNSFHEFKIAKLRGKSREHCSYKEVIEDFSSTFINMLEEIQSQYSSFPLYVMQLKAEEYAIPKEEVPILIKRYLLDGRLIKTKEGYFILTR